MQIAAVAPPSRWLSDPPATLTRVDFERAHGFAILNGVRAGIPHAESLAMDRATLLAHEDRWGSESAPTSARVPQLTPSEAGLYRDLGEDTCGPRVRLEQERLDWAHVEALIGAAGLDDAAAFA